MILDFSKKNNVKIEFINLDGEKFEYDGVVSASLLEQAEISQKEMMKEMSKNQDLKDIQNQNIKISTAKMFEIQDKNDKEMLKTFFGDKYAEYVSKSKGIENQVNAKVIELINTSIDDLTESMEDTGGKKK